jgi:hypothetical protein
LQPSGKPDVRTRHGVAEPSSFRSIIAIWNVGFDCATAREARAKVNMIVCIIVGGKKQGTKAPITASIKVPLGKQRNWNETQTKTASWGLVAGGRCN